MTDLTVTKAVGYVVAGPAPTDLSVSKVVAYLVIDTNVIADPGSIPAARRRVRTTARAATPL